MKERRIPKVITQMLIRRPVGIVYQAFIDPEITTNFWFTKSTGRLEAGKTIRWEWEMYGASADVFVKDLIRNKEISIEWGNPSTAVDFRFTELAGDMTYVEICHYGFQVVGNELLQAVMDSTGGFTTVLDGLKAFLEHDIRLNLIADKFPKEVTDARK